jgi:MFS transporter, ACS family, hexuronate transporter
VATVAGIGGTAGALGAILLLKLTSLLFDSTASNSQTYTILFIIAGAAYVAALGCFHFLVPKLEPVTAEGAR